MRFRRAAHADHDPTFLCMVQIATLPLPSQAEISVAKTCSMGGQRHKGIGMNTEKETVEEEAEAAVVAEMVFGDPAAPSCSSS